MGTVYKTVFAVTFDRPYDLKLFAIFYPKAIESANALLKIDVAKAVAPFPENVPLMIKLPVTASSIATFSKVRFVLPETVKLPVITALPLIVILLLMLFIVALLVTTLEVVIILVISQQKVNPK